MVIPSEREADVTGILLAAHTRLALEQTSELFTEEDLEPPPFDLVALGLVNASNVTSSPETSTATSTPHTSDTTSDDGVVEDLAPVQCSE